MCDSCLVNCQTCVVHFPLQMVVSCFMVSLQNMKVPTWGYIQDLLARKSLLSHTGGINSYNWLTRTRGSKSTVQTSLLPSLESWPQLSFTEMPVCHVPHGASFAIPVIRCNAGYIQMRIHLGTSTCCFLLACVRYNGHRLFNWFCFLNLIYLLYDSVL